MDSTREPDFVREFLIESNENLARLDQELVALEKNPNDALLDSVFRTMHTVKGTAGMLCFPAVEGIAHLVENLLSQLRKHTRVLNSALVSVILQAADAIKQELATIEASNEESGNAYQELKAQLKIACDTRDYGVVSKVVEEKTGTASPKAGGPAVSKNHSEDSTIRVDVAVLDRLMNLVGELVLARNQVLQLRTQAVPGLNATAQRLDLITTELQETVMKTRMQPIGVIWSKLPRIVRDLAASAKKNIAVEMTGSETELDKTIIEAIRDPLTHIVRNCCDHGIESPADRERAGKPAQGCISLHAFHEGGQVNIEIRDDGGGIDPRRLKEKAIAAGLLPADQIQRMSEKELVNLIFLPGFSTAEKVTAISGRGVGMDVVKTNIEKIGGVVDIASEVGQGTTLHIKIPLTLAIIPGLVVMAGSERFVIPQASLLELIALGQETGSTRIEHIHGVPVYRRRGKLLPLVYLHRILGLPKPSDTSDSQKIVVLQADERQFGLVVDRVCDSQETVVKALGKQLRGLDFYAGACIMGDGQVALILDVMGVGKRARLLAEAHDTAEKSDGSEAVTKETSTFLVFAGQNESRMAVPIDLVDRLEKIKAGQLERAGMQWVTQYRGQILPLIDLRSNIGNDCQSMPGGASPTLAADDVLQLFVCHHAGTQIGFIVHRIIDTIEDTIRLTYPATRAGVLYSAVIKEKVTEVVDVAQIVTGAGVQIESPARMAVAAGETR